MSMVGVSVVQDGVLKMGFAQVGIAQIGFGEVSADQIGARVVVLYPAGEPGRGTIERFSDLWLGPLLTGVLGGGRLLFWGLPRMRRPVGDQACGRRGSPGK